MLEAIGAGAPGDTSVDIDAIIDFTLLEEVFSADRLRPGVGRTAASLGRGNTGDAAQVGPDHAAVLRQWGDWNQALQIQEGRGATAEIVQISPLARTVRGVDLALYTVANEVMSYPAYPGELPGAARADVEGAELIEAGNFAVQRQTGEDHDARTVQVGWALVAEITQAGSSHFAAVLQQGFDHSARIRQSGSGATALISQDGSGNTAAIEQSGERLYAEIRQ